MRDRFGVDAIQFYDHNFFDREVDMVPLLEVLAKFQLPWWCFARSDALVNLSERPGRWSERAGCAWRTSARNRRAIGCCTTSARARARDQTLQAVETCRRHGVIPELSFMLAPPRDPEGETEKTFDFIRMIKRVHPATEVMIYIYTPLPRRWDDKNSASARMASELRDCEGNPVVFPPTADGWAESKWVDYWCHQDAPWCPARLRRRIVDFTTVLGCRYPTVMDIRASAWGKSALRALAAWRYRFQRYDPSLGAARVAKAHSSLGSAGHEPVTMASRAALHAVQISFFSDPEGRSPAQLLDAWPTLVDVAEAAARSGIRVSVVQASAHSERLSARACTIIFCPLARAERQGERQQ